MGVTEITAETKKVRAEDVFALQELLASRQDLKRAKLRNKMAQMKFNQLNWKEEDLPYLLMVSSEKNYPSALN